MREFSRQIAGVQLYHRKEYKSLHLLFALQKKTIRIITFSSFFEHTSPLFKELNVLKLFDEVTFHIAVFAYRFKINFSLLIFMFFFTTINEIYNYNTRLSSRRLVLYPKLEQTMESLILEIRVLRSGIRMIYVITSRKEVQI